MYLDQVHTLKPGMRLWAPAHTIPFTDGSYCEYDRSYIIADFDWSGEDPILWLWDVSHVPDETSYKTRFVGNEYVPESVGCPPCTKPVVIECDQLRPVKLFDYINELKIKSRGVTLYGPMLERCLTRTFEGVARGCWSLKTSENLSYRLQQWADSLKEKVANDPSKSYIDEEYTPPGDDGSVREWDNPVRPRTPGLA